MRRETSGAAKRSAAFALAACTAVFAMLPRAARADYAVLRSGARLHITSYEVDGDKTRLTFRGGVLEVPSSEIAAIEPEDTFQAIPPVSPNAAAAAQGPYEDLIRAAAAKHGVDEALIEDVIEAESNFNPKAVSRRQALGLMQLRPETATEYAVRDAFDPAQNIEAGTHYLRDLLTRYRGDLKLALAAYNAGPDVVDRYRGVPPFAETKQYVQRVLAAYGKTVVALQ